MLHNSLQPLDLHTLQVNIGRQCNQRCTHCHINASPRENDLMTSTTMKQVIQLARTIQPALLDITGGAPELHPNLCAFIECAYHVIPRIQVRTNLTVLSPSYHDTLIRFFTDKHVKLIASLPCYLKDEVDNQRGAGVFEMSIRVLQQLNRQGYGVNPSLPLDLVYNPDGAFLPPHQSELESKYREILEQKYNIVFNRLLTITNMPIGRFQAFLHRTQQEARYQKLLTSTFNPLTLPQLMCRYQIHVGSDGQLYDCDFNYGLGMPCKLGEHDLSTVSSEILHNRYIVTGDHCFGCTAGHGSSCNGALDL
jgi:radical SAM/Cys-rich protein